MATTLSLVVIFVPVAFMTGQIGRYFYSFGITSAAAILLSMFVSFTLTPALCAWWLKPEDVKSDHSTTKSSGFYARMDRVYGAMLGWSMRHRLTMIGIAAAVTVSAVFLYPYVGKELVPDDDQGEFNVNVRLPRGTSYQRTEEYAQPIEKEIIALPALRRVRIQVNPGSASFGCHDGRSRGTEDLAAGAHHPHARDAAEISGRAHQRVRRHRHLRRLDRAGRAADAAAVPAVAAGRRIV